MHNVSAAAVIERAESILHNQAGASGLVEARVGGG
jgi:hypothetical protein